MMEKNSFVSLSREDACITDISCVEYQWNTCRKNEYPDGRDQNILCFSMSDNKRLISPEDGTVLFDVEGASIFFIRQNTPYISEATVHEGGEAGYTACIKFTVIDKQGNNVLLSDKYLCWKNINKDFYLYLLKSVINAYISVNPNGYAVKSAFYKLMAELVNSLQTEMHSRDGFEELLPAIKYLENNLGKNATIDELAKLCFLSKSHFSKRFKEYTGGINLTDYRNKMRIEKAKELMASPMWSTTMIAEVLGFYDISHFCRVYKKYTGESVSDKALINIK